MKTKLSNQKGFTIIEVLIVLAIAGLIMLIVFMAVPALQRNSRNTQRNNDASRVAAGVTECLANRNGQVASCNTAALLAPFVNPATLGQLTTVAVGAPAYTTNTATITFNSGCSAAGDAAAGTPGPRTFSLTFQLEPGINRCIAS